MDALRVKPPSDGVKHGDFTGVLRDRFLASRISANAERPFRPGGDGVVIRSRSFEEENFFFSRLKVGRCVYVRGHIPNTASRQTAR